VLSGTEFRQLTKGQLTLAHIDEIWSTLFERSLSDDMPSAEPDAVLRELYERARRRGMLSSLLTEVIKLIPDLRSTLDSWLSAADTADFQTQLDNKIKAGRVILPYPRYRSFKGRQTELERTHRTLTSYNRAAIQAVAGLGGLGKTQLALEYAYRYHQDYQYIFWVAADNSATIEISYRQIAEKLRLGTRKLAVSGSSTDLVREWLSNNDNWLLIFNNVEDFSAIEDYLPAENRGQVLLTTRLMSTGSYGLIRLRKFTLAEGQDFLCERNAREELTTADEQAIAALVREVDGLPLALDLAACYVVQGGISWFQYGELYQKAGFKPLATKKAGPTGRENWIKLVYKVLMLTLERLRQANPAAWELIHLTAFLAADGIEEELFQHGDLANCPNLQELIINGSGIDWEDMLDLLQQFALIKRAVGHWGVHPLTQLVIRDSLTAVEQQKYLAQIARLLGLEFPVVATSPEASLPPALQPHLRALKHYWAEYNTVSVSDVVTPAAVDVSDGSNLTTNSSATSGTNRDEAARLANSSTLKTPLTVDLAANVSIKDTNSTIKDSVVKANVVVDIENTVSSANTNGVNSNAANNSDANNLPMQTDLLFAGSIAAAVLGAPPKDSKQATKEAKEAAIGQGTTPLIEQGVKKELSNFTSGVFEIARPSGELSSASLAHTSGALSLEEDLAETESAESPAEITGSSEAPPRASRASTAIKGRRVRRHSQALPRNEEEFDAALTSSTGGGKAPAALSETGSLVPKIKSVTNKVSNENQLIRSANASSQTPNVINKTANNNELAVNMAQMELAESVAERKRSDYFFRLQRLAALWIEQGKYTEAESLYLEMLTVGARLFGEDGKEYAAILNELGECYFQQGRYEEAEPLLQQALMIRKVSLGGQHPLYLNSLHTLAGLYYKQGGFAAAEQLFQEALEISRRCNGINHPDYATGLHNLARLYYKQGRYEEAEPLYKEALMIWRESLGEEHLHYATGLNSLASLYYAQGRYEEAERLYSEDLMITKAILGDSHSEYATSLHSLARLYTQQGRDNEAEALYQQALAIKSKIFPRSHPDIARIEQDFMDLLKKQGYEDSVAELNLRREAIAAHATQMLKKKTQQLS
jgi:tetratricopeptide (TPR) repeat protein